MTYALGIDVGATFSAAAVWRDGRAETVPLGNRADAVPSVVLLREDGRLLVGDAAARRAASEPRLVAREFKRRIGDRVPVLLGDRPIEPERLFSAMVAWIVERVAEREGGAPAHVVLTCPATWGAYRRGLVRQAARQSGLTNAGILVEPVAAAIQYASLQRVEPGLLIGVYDFGGGTFDATVLRKTAEGFAIEGTPQGDDNLGGSDFDQAVMAHVAASLDQTWSRLDLTDMVTLRAVAQVRANAVEAKEALSTDVEAGIAVILPGVTRQVRLTRAEFEVAARPQLQRTVEVFKQTAAGAGIEAAQLHRVLLVGGSSRIPLVSQLLTRQLGVQVALDAHPTYAVCLGAAIAAGTRLAATRQGPGTARSPLVAAVPGSAVAPGGDAAPRSPDGSVTGTAAFNAVVGDGSSDGGAGHSARVDVDVADRGLTMPLDIPIEDVTAANETDRVDDGVRGRLIDRVQRGGGRRPGLVATTFIGVVVAAAALIALFVTSRSTPSQQAAPLVAGNEAGQDAPDEDVDAPPPQPTPNTDEREDRERGNAVGRFDLNNLELTDVSPQPLPGIEAGSDTQVESFATRDATFVAVGRTPSDTGFDALVLRSSDGQTWQRVDSPALGGDGDQLMFAAADGPDAVVGVGFDGAQARGDGAVWLVGDDDRVTRVESQELGGDGFQEIRDVIWHDGRYIAVGCSDTTSSDKVCDANETGGQQATIWVSPDGQDWSRLPADAISKGTNAAMRAITPSAAGLVAVGHQQTAGESTRQAAFWFSEDGEQWKRISVELRPGVLTSSATGIAANDSGVVAVGYDDVGSEAGDKDEAFWFSQDGMSWEQVAPDDTARRPANQVAVDALGVPNGFVAVGRDFTSGANAGAVWVSTDGRQWQRSYEDVFPVDGAIIRHAAASAEHLVLGGFSVESDALGVRLYAAPALEDP